MRFFFLLCCQILSVVLSGLFFISCQQKPTQITSEQPILTDVSSAGVQKWLQALLKEDPVILDVRSTFDFNLSHVPRAVNVHWEDFTQQEASSRGVLDKDLLGLAHRLALVGVTPQSRVLILGKALEGQGEEGRFAWMLQVLGVRRLATLNHKELRALRVQDNPPIENKPLWKPQEDESLTVSLNVFKQMAMGPAAGSSQSVVTRARSRALQMPAAVVAKVTRANLFGMPLDEAQKKSVILDVRSPAQFAHQNLAQKKSVVVPVVNIFWKEFYSERGLVSDKVAASLSAQKITKDSVIFVISNQGLESGAVTYALRTLGYAQSANFAGGYEQWGAMK